MGKLISIVTPSFNQARFIEANIKSVLGQNYDEFEHIVIDGGSTDGTVEILKNYPHLRWVSEKDGGQTDALNKGFSMARGDIVGWLNSDDTYCPSVFHQVAEQFQDPEVKVLCGDGFEIDEAGLVTHPLSSRNSGPRSLIRYWKWKYEFVQPAFFFSRDLFSAVGPLDEKLYYAMDYDFFIRLGLKYHFRYMPVPLANLRMYPESKSGRNVGKMMPDNILEMHKVSKRYWGPMGSPAYLGNLASFSGAVFFSVIKNLFFSPTSKSRIILKRYLKLNAY